MPETLTIPVREAQRGDVLHRETPVLINHVERVGIHIYLYGPANLVHFIYDDADTVDVSRSEDPSCGLVVVKAGELRRHDWVQAARGHGFHVDRIDTNPAGEVEAHVGGTVKNLGNPDGLWVVERQRTPISYARADGLGEYLVRLDHNPSDSDTVYALKEAAAAFIDLIADLVIDDVMEPFDGNWERSLALERAAEAAMWAVRAATHQ